MSRRTKSAIPSAFTVAERDLAAELGLAQDLLKATRQRHLEEGLDWQHTGGCVRYSPAGHAKTLEVLKISAEPGPAEAAPEPEPEAAAVPAVALEPTPAASAGVAAPQIGEIHDLVCTKKYVPNHQIVEASFRGETVRVRMRDNRNMKPGMPMKCKFNGTPIWELAQRCPRFPGRW